MIPPHRHLRLTFPRILGYHLFKKYRLNLFFIFLLSFLYIPFIFSADPAYKYEVCVLAIFQDEADYLKEWIDYHRTIGVDHFVLLNHYSNDNYKEVLQPYVDDKIIELYNWREPEFPKCQLNANRWGLGYLKDKAKWVAIIDIDEFIVPKKHFGIKDFLDEYEMYAGVIINWQIFGTSNYYYLSPEEGILKHLLYKFPENFDDPLWNSNYFVKSIVRPDRIEERNIDSPYGCHVFKASPEYYIVDTNKNPILAPVPKHSTVLVDKIQINHYWFRTEKWFYQNKIWRRRAVGDVYTDAKIEYLFAHGNSQLDLSIQRFINMFKL